MNAHFSNEYTELYDYFLSQPHRKRTFHKDEYLWKPGELIHKVYYIISGISVTYAKHEEGRRKILFFHTTGSVFPGFHESTFKIERSIITRAISDMETLEFSREEVYRMFQENRRMSNITFES